MDHVLKHTEELGVVTRRDQRGRVILSLQHQFDGTEEVCDLAIGTLDHQFVLQRCGVVDIGREIVWGVVVQGRVLWMLL